MKDREILRKLAHEYAECAFEKVNKERIKIHTSVNDLKPIRPTLLLQEFPWHELNIDGFLDLQCEDSLNRQMELDLRRKILNWKKFAGDMMLEDYIGIEKMIIGEDIGVQISEERATTDEKNNIVGHHYINQFESIEDLDKLKFANITYLKEETQKKYQHFAEMLSDILPVKIVGIPTGYMVGNITWDIISQIMGVNDLFYNIVDEPEFMHALVRKLTDIFIDKMDQYEKLNLFSAEALYCHAGAAVSTKLKNEPIVDGKVTRKNVWGRGLAQILTSVSPEMHDEFDIQYMIESLSGFGLNYYGCCEALDKKIDIVKKIPNLRKISISPWADINVSAEQIGSDYVMCAKPNPAILGGSSLDVDLANKEIDSILKAAEKNNCPVELLMKDISTIGYNPQNLIDWTNLVMSKIN